MLVNISRKGLVMIMAGLMLGTLLSALDLLVIATAVTDIASDLGNLSQTAWIFTAYLLGVGVVMPVWGKLGDTYGRGSMYNLAILLFMGSSLIAGAAASMMMLVVARLIQGVAAGGLLALSHAIIGDIAPARNRGVYFASITSVWATAAVLGPLVGGALVDTIGWRWIFYINLPVGGCALGLIFISGLSKKLKDQVYDQQPPPKRTSTTPQATDLQADTDIPTGAGIETGAGIDTDLDVGTNVSADTGVVTSQDHTQVVTNRQTQDAPLNLSANQPATTHQNPSADQPITTHPEHSSLEPSPSNSPQPNPSPTNNPNSPDSTSTADPTLDPQKPNPPNPVEEQVVARSNPTPNLKDPEPPNLARPPTGASEPTPPSPTPPSPTSPSKSGLPTLIRGASLLILGLGVITLATSLVGDTWEPNSFWFIGSLILGFAIMVVFVRSELKLEEQLIPLEMFNYRVVTSGSLTNFFFGLGNFGVAIILPLYAQIVNGVSATLAGLTLAPVAVGIFFSTLAVGALIRRSGRYRLYPILGCGIYILGVFLLLSMDQGTSRPIAMLFAFVTGIGNGMLQPVIILSVQNAVPRKDMGSATSVATTSRSMGQTIGSAILGAIITTSLTSRLTGLGLDADTYLDSPEEVQNLSGDLADQVVSAYHSALDLSLMAVVACIFAAMVTSFFIPQEDLGSGQADPDPELEPDTDTELEPDTDTESNPDPDPEPAAGQVAAKAVKQ